MLMKRFLLFWSLTLITSAALAQLTWNKAYYPDAVPFLIEINSSIYCCGPNGITKFNKLGGTAYTYTDGSTNILAPTIVGNAMYNTSDNKIFLVTSGRFCDVYFPKQANSIAKFDTTGTKLFSTIDSVSVGDDYTTSTQHSDSSYYTFTSTSLFHHSKAGALISKINLGLSNISASILMPNGNILLSAMSGTLNSLVLISPSGSVISTYPAQSIMKKFLFYGNQKIMALDNNGRFYKYSGTFAQLGVNPQTTFDVIDFAQKNDTLYSIASTGTLQSYVLQDTSFNVLASSTTTTSKISQLAIMATSWNKVAILNRGIANVSTVYLMPSYNFPWDQPFASLNVINKASTNNFSKDIELQSVNADSTYFWDSSGGQGLDIGFALRPGFRIKNNGSTALNNLNLSCYEHVRVDCGGTYYSEHFSNLNLNPGDTITLHAKKFCEILYGNSPPSHTAAVNFCFFTSLPNGETDKVLENDEICKTFTFLATGLKEFNPGLQNTIISPNPFNTCLKIESENVLTKIVLTDVLGKEIISLQGIQTKAAEINVDGLFKGIYFLNVFDKNSFIVKKVIKE